MDDSIHDEGGNIILHRIMQDVGLGTDTEICQYMRMDHLKKLLTNKEYFVNRKEKFIDKREQSIPFKLHFTEISPVGSNLSPEQKKRCNERTKTIQYFNNESLLLLTSCWTERITENALMWDRNSEIRKACIKSRIGNFFRAFGNINYTIWCGKMLYEPIYPVLMSEDIIWYKEPYFSDEREIRFYFSKEFSRIVPDKVPGDSEKFPVDIETLIHEIVFSPYAEEKDKDEIKGIISSQGYKIKTTSSNIKIKS